MLSAKGYRAPTGPPALIPKNDDLDPASAEEQFEQDRMENVDARFASQSPLFETSRNKPKTDDSVPDILVNFIITYEKMRTQYINLCGFAGAVSKPVDGVLETPFEENMKTLINIAHFTEPLFHDVQVFQRLVNTKDEHSIYEIIDNALRLIHNSYAYHSLYALKPVYQNALSQTSVFIMNQFQRTDVVVNIQLRNLRNVSPIWLLSIADNTVVNVAYAYAAFIVNRTQQMMNTRYTNNTMYQQTAIMVTAHLEHAVLFRESQSRIASFFRATLPKKTTTLSEKKQYPGYILGTR